MLSGRIYGKFYGVYLLSNLHPIRPRTYIGFTVEPDRRLKQHNGGLDEGGAKKTNNKGPWEMVLIVHGFPNEYMALKILSCYEKNYVLTRTSSSDFNTWSCYICLGNSTEDMTSFGCLNEDCNATFHSNCLGQHLLKSEIGELIPVHGTCPKCCHSIIWVDIITLFLKSQ